MLGKLWGKRCSHSVEKVRDVARPSSNHTSTPSAFYAGDYNLITFILHKTRWDRCQALIFTLAAEAGSRDSSLMFKDAPSSSTWNVERGVGNERKSYAHAPRILYFSSAPVSSSRGRRFVCLTTRQTWNVETRNVEARLHGDAAGSTAAPEVETPPRNETLHHKRRSRRILKPVHRARHP